VQTLRPGDRPSDLLMARCRSYQGQRFPADWDGVHRMESK
jgi:hypothetical protein